MSGERHILPMRKVELSTPSSLNAVSAKRFLPLALLFKKGHMRLVLFAAQEAPSASDCVPLSYPDVGKSSFDF